MVYAKYINEKAISLAPRCIYIGDTTITNPTAEQYSEAGFYKIVKVEPTSTPKKWYHFENRYALKEPTKEHKLTWIEHTYLEVKDDEPDRDELIVKKIRANYSLNAELAIQRQKDNSEEKAQDFEEYNTFCDTCKAEADAEIKEWEEA